MQNIRLFTILFSLLLLLLVGCDNEEGGCAAGVDECGVCGGNDNNNDNYCQSDLDILQAIKNENNSLNSTSLEDIGYQIWEEFTYNGYVDGWDSYENVPYRRLVMLDISNNQITKIPYEISNFRFGELITLNLSNNQIETVPLSICSLKSYTYIYLDSNNICNESIYSCFEQNNQWHINNQNHSNCCEGPENQLDWTACSCENLDCSYIDEECIIGACSNDECISVLLPNGTTCDDSDPSTNNDMCNDGACIGNP